MPIKLFYYPTRYPSEWLNTSEWHYTLKDRTEKMDEKRNSQKRFQDIEITAIRYKEKRDKLYIV